MLFVGLIGLKANYRAEIYKAYVDNKMQDWKVIVDRIDALKNKDNALILELINYQYGYIAWCIGNKKDDEAEKYLAKAEKNVLVLEKENYNLSMVNAYKSAFYGFRIGLNVLQAPFVGQKSSDCAKLAIKLDSKNPFGYVQYGNVQYYMPKIFGGSKTVALSYYLKAKELMEMNRDFIQEDWNYLSLLTILGKAYWDIGDLNSAKIYFEKIMAITPEYDWVKKEMYPLLIKTMKENRTK
jgi:tetratricopeptide (TPR) repeat protein